ncbi:MAG TPA: radical SAM protein [Longimicrobiales bacterium]|nr:radical SAM protein [Longimicrobiales bacterium]
MRSKRRIGIVDLVTKAPTRAVYARVMHPSFASIMPQAVGVWCEEKGHDVSYVCYTGFEDLLQELPDRMDLLFIGAFTQAAQLAYAISNMFRQRGAITALGGPHARCYPDDARKYFDYVLGFTDQAVLDDVLRDCSQHRPLGVQLSAARQPTHLPGVRERWKFIAPTLAKAPTRIKIVPMIGSLGCPYTCSFCIDSVVDYQPMSYDQIREDLRFLVKTQKRPAVGWHDPNFGVRFDEIVGTIEEAVRPGTISFVAESSLSLLAEEKLKRLKTAGFMAMLPGIESWFSLGNKAKTGRKQGLDKVDQVSEHVNLILRYIPYVQTNFVLGLDDDVGAEPFELTKQFLYRSAGAFPGYSLLSAFGEAAPLNLELQRAGRVLPFPFHFLNNNHAMNVRPKHYSWPEFYDRVIDLSKYSFSWKIMARRARATPPGFATWLNLVRGISSEGFGRIKFYTKVRELLDTDRSVAAYFAGETQELPAFYAQRMQHDLGPLWDFLPPGAMYHDHTAYLAKQATQPEIRIAVRRPRLETRNDARVGQLPDPA